MIAHAWKVDARLSEHHKYYIQIDVRSRDYDPSQIVNLNAPKIRKQIDKLTKK